MSASEAVWNGRPGVLAMVSGAACARRWRECGRRTGSSQRSAARIAATTRNQEPPKPRNQEPPNRGTWSPSNPSATEIQASEVRAELVGQIGAGQGELHRGLEEAQLVPGVVAPTGELHGE